MKRQNTKEREIAEEGFWRNPAILWLRRGRREGGSGGNMRQITQEKTGKLPKAR